MSRVVEGRSPADVLWSKPAPRWSRPEYLALILGMGGTGWRLAMMLNGTPPTNSDEAIFGLAAMHIAEGREFPIFFYGQHYMGTLEPFLAAPLFGVFGPSVFLQRILPLLFYALFLYLMFKLSRTLFSPGIAVATVAFLAFGSDRIVKNELIGGGGYPEVNPLLAGLFLIGIGLASNSYRRENFWFAAWGILFGLIVWTHWLAAPYLLAAAISLAVTCWVRLTWRKCLTTVSGVLLGAGPLLWHNLTAPKEFNSIAVFLALSSAGGDPSLWDRVYGGAIFGLPLASGLCPVGRCDLPQLLWGPVYLALLSVASVWGIRALRHNRQGDHVQGVVTLMLVFAAGLTVILYVRSAGAAETANESARYLHYLLVSTPVWIWVLWRMAKGALGRLGRMTSGVILFGVIIAVSFATIDLGRQAAVYSAWDKQTNQVVGELEARGIKGVYGGYWTCNKLIFASSEEILCGVLSDDLKRGLNRYSPYWEAVQSQPTPAAFLVLASSNITEPENELNLAVQAFLQDSGSEFTTAEVGGYVLYILQEPVPLPFERHG